MSGQAELLTRVGAGSGEPTCQGLLRILRSQASKRGELVRSPYRQSHDARLGPPLSRARAVGSRLGAQQHRVKFFDEFEREAVSMGKPSVGQRRDRRLKGSNQRRVPVVGMREQLSV